MRDVRDKVCGGVCDDVVAVCAMMSGDLSHDSSDDF